MALTIPRLVLHLEDAAQVVEVLIHHVYVGPTVYPSMEDRDMMPYWERVSCSVLYFSVKELERP